MSSDGHIITHYQKAIKKARNDEVKLLHCISKLFELPITIEHLQSTGVGKTVNSLRKYNGEVGTAAKTLVAKWKAMVATEEISDKPEDVKIMGNGFITNNFEVKSCELSPLKGNANSKQSMSECKFTQNSSNISNQKSYQGDKDSSESSQNCVILSKTKNDFEKDNKESKQKDKKGRSRHMEKNNPKSYSSSNLNSKGNSKHFSVDSHTNNTMPKGNNPGSDSFDTSKKKILDVSAQTIYPKAKKAKLLVDDGIDSSMGASFSDALGMCGIANNKKAKKSQRHSTGSKIMEQVCQQRVISNKLNTIPDALKLMPQSKLDGSLNLSLSPVLKITDNYRPAPINQNVMNCIYPSPNIERTSSTNGDALSIGISSKTMRTKVYSGVKTGAILIVPSLFDICIRVLQKNIDALEYTGGVPFDVLRPVLERSTPQQLLSFEDYNAYLLDDTDVLWELHVKRNFRGEIKRDRESWREMFLRCEEDKERRLNILTKNIKISQKQSALPVRKTRLAYVDNVVKPPRNIQRKQEQYGTNGKLIASPAARVAALSSVSHNAVMAGDPRLRISRDLGQSTGSNQIRPKKAPLMAKTLQFIKKRYKR